MTSPLPRSLNPYDCLAANSSSNPKADPRLTTSLALSHEEALRARVSYAADHPLRRKSDG